MNKKLKTTLVLGAGLVSGMTLAYFTKGKTGIPALVGVVAAASLNEMNNEKKDDNTTSDTEN